MPSNEIAVVLGGAPQMVMPASEGAISWYYFLSGFRSDAIEMGEAYITGVTLLITNGHLATWACSFATMAGERSPETQASTKEGAGAQAPAGTRLPLRLFVVSDRPISSGRHIDTENLPRLGYVNQAADLTIASLRDVKVGERKTVAADTHSTVWTFNVQLSPEDGERLKVLTKANLSNRLLITLGDEPVSAPTVMAPLEGSGFVIECTESALAGRLKAGLEALVAR